MTTVKFTVAVAVNVPAPDVKVDAAEAMSGSVSAAVPSKLFNTIDVFIFCFLCCAALCKAILGDSLTATIEPKSQFDSTGLKFCRRLPTFLDFCALVNTKSAAIARPGRSHGRLRDLQWISAAGGRRGSGAGA
jgi:hypothetical protein